MGLENILHGLKGNLRRKLITSAIISSSLIGCSGPTENNQKPKQPKTQPQNHAPAFVQTPITSGDENRDYNSQCLATDQDGNTITYSFSQAPSWLSINPQNCSITGVLPEVSQTTSFPVTINALDGKTSTPYAYNLTVNNLFNTYLMDGSTINALEAASYSQGILAFTRPMNFAVNDIIAAGIADILPNGFLGRITALSPDKRVIYTTHVSLEEILKKATLSYKKDLSLFGIQSFKSMPGVSISQPNLLAQLQGFNFGIYLRDVVLYDRDGNPNTKSDQVIANGEIDFDTRFSFDIDIDDFKLKYLKFQNKTSELADITIGSNLLGIATKKEIKLTEFVFSPFVIGYLPTVIPIPLVVTPKIGVYIGMDPTQVNPLGFRVKQNANLDAWLAYNGLWSTGKNFSNDFDFSIFNPTGNWNLKVAAGPRLEMLLYDMAGPVAGANGKLRLASQTGGGWKLYGGFESYIGVIMEFFSKKIAAHSEMIFDYEEILAQSGTTPPPQPVKTDTLRAGKDAYIAWSNIPNSAFPNTNYNTTSLKLKRDEGRSYEETLIQFPINSLPTGAIINSAKIIMYGYCVNNSANPSVNLDLRKIIGNWGESSVTWNSKPSYSSKTYSSLVAPVKANFRAEKDITSLTQEWSSDRNQNYGAALIIDENMASCSLDSRESSDPNTRPMLVVSYR